MLISAPFADSHDTLTNFDTTKMQAGLDPSALHNLSEAPPTWKIIFHLQDKLR